MSEKHIAVARGQLLLVNSARRRGPKSEAAMTKAINKIITRYKVGDGLQAGVSADEVERFKQTRKGRATLSSPFKRSLAKVVKVSVFDNVNTQSGLNSGLIILNQFAVEKAWKAISSSSLYKNSQSGS